MRKLSVISTLLVSCYTGTVVAEEALSCHFGYENDFLPAYTGDPEQSEVDVKADDVQILETGTSVFSGDVDVTRAGQQLNAQRATYNRNSGDVTASGDVRLRDSEMIINAQDAEWSLSNDEGKMLDAEYRIRQMHARGEASHVYRQGREKTDLKNATYTTCAEGDNAWMLKASELHLDHVNAVGEAEDVVLRLGGVPVFYTPYISFPLNDERKSGFLPPSLGSSSETGFDIQAPYYWNIAPNLDATLMPRFMADRGVMLAGQFRYLFEHSDGEMEAAFLGSDDQRQNGNDLNPYYKEDRKLFSWQHQSQFSNRWRARLDYNYVSDDNYFRDFGSSLNLSSRTHMNRLFETVYSGDNWNLTGRLQGYQTLADVEKPYQRLPQLLFNGYLPDQALGLNYALKAEYVDFDHSDKVRGQRIDFEPSVSLPMGTAAFYATPRVALSHTRYSLDNDLTNSYDDSATRTVPITSFDTGVFFDRAVTIGGGSYVHTLEPRAFYLYIPHRDQSDIPVFDSALSTFNMIQLFSYDRFIGGDRIGDANQLSLAVTSRLINEETGKENLRLTVGQIRYFRDRKVTLPNGQVDTRADSDLVAEAVAYIANNWSASGEIQWDPSESQTSMSAVGLRYRGDHGGIFNISHRYRREDAAISPLPGLEQVDVSAQMPIDERWSVFGRWYHSLDQGRTLEGLAGVEFDNCCWATRFMVRNYVNDVTVKDRNIAFYFQIELKGLGSFGNKTDTLLSRSIRGFQTD